MQIVRKRTWDIFVLERYWGLLMNLIGVCKIDTKKDLSFFYLSPWVSSGIIS